MRFRTIGSRIYNGIALKLGSELLPAPVHEVPFLEAFDWFRIRFNLLHVTLGAEDQKQNGAD
jgi:hypothetical protein